MRNAVGRLFAVALALGGMTPALHAADQSLNAGTVFVMTNAADKNEVLAYQRLFDGRLVLNERFPTGGRGSGGTTDPLQAQGSLTLSQDRTELFVINSGSGTVSSFHLLAGLPILIDQQPTGGSEPVAVAQHQNLVYVLNAGGSGSIVAFHVDAIGHLQQIPKSTTYLTAAHSGGSSITISPDGRFLAVTERVPNHIDLFAIRQDGTLGPIVTTTDTTPGVFSASFLPTGQLIVSETGTEDSSFSSYAVSPTGTLTPVTQSIPTLGQANCWNAITPNGKFAYVSNAATSTIAGFSVGAGGVLTPIGGTLVGSTNGGGNLDIAISHDGKFLYSLDSGAGAISIFGINADGSLTPYGNLTGLLKNAGINGIAAL